ncbi:MAG: LapA family protein [Betaproteobacteria bacterium]|nr:LapA family protein [Betaproteobacteria bacterium]
MKILRYFFWLLLSLLFVLLLVFAIRNTAPVRLRFFFDQSWDVPLILLLLVFFVIGACLGVLASLERIIRQRRELLVLKRTLQAPKDSPPPVSPTEVV